jgi:hypothetical protein
MNCASASGARNLRRETTEMDSAPLTPPPARPSRPRWKSRAPPGSG